MRLQTLLAAALLLAPVAAHAVKPDPPPDHWVTTWATASYAIAGSRGNLGAADMTYREIVRASLGGPLLRVELTNRFGTEPLIIGAVHLALAANGGDIQLGSANALTFNGQASITIPPGAIAVSDPAAIALPANADLAVSLFIPAQTITTGSLHGGSHTTSYMAAGNVVGLKTLPSPKKMTSWAFLEAVDVKTTYDTGTIVAFGDSITDGAASTLDGHDTWPAVLARRIHDNPKTKELAVVNEGIGGNLLLRNGNDNRQPGAPPPPPGGDPKSFGTGLSALTRFDADVLALAGVRYVIVLEGINDIGHSENPNGGIHDEPADTLIQGYVQLIERAHDHGIKVFVATLTPYQGAKYATPSGEQTRKALNAWIRTNRLADGFIDFEAAARDKSSADALAASADSGDHLHPSPAGYKAMADAIDLKLFEPTKQEKYDISHQP